MPLFVRVRDVHLSVLKTHIKRSHFTTPQVLLPSHPHLPMRPGLTLARGTVWREGSRLSSTIHTIGSASLALVMIGDTANRLIGASEAGKESGRSGTNDQTDHGGVLTAGLQTIMAESIRFAARCLASGDLRFREDWVQRYVGFLRHTYSKVFKMICIL